MRVAWVHPSWRDLVIEHLARDARAREHFLGRCSVHGALLALSIAGGPTGERRHPLLERDADWDALTDRLYTLVPQLAQRELVALLDGLALAARQPPTAELDALARAVLGRVTGQWDARRAPIPLAPLEAWTALAALLSPTPPLPAIATTWAELLPTSTPDLAEPAGVECFADWLALAAMLDDYEPTLLAELSFPGSARQYIDGLVDALEDRPYIPPASTEHVVRALQLTAALVDGLADRANRILYRFAGTSEWDDQVPPPAPDDVPEGSGHLDVERVLRDL